jgi:hypothetical protein
MAINVDLARALSPLLSLRGAVETPQQQTTTAPADGTLEGLLGGLSSQAPMTQQEQMRRQIGGMFGVDTRSPAEKLTEQIAQAGLGNSSEDLKRMAEMARDLKLPAQAANLFERAAIKREQEAIAARQEAIDMLNIQAAGQQVSINAQRMVTAGNEEERAQAEEIRRQAAVNRDKELHEARVREANLKGDEAQFNLDEAKKKAAKVPDIDRALDAAFPDNPEIAELIALGQLTVKDAITALTKPSQPARAITDAERKSIKTFLKDQKGWFGFDEPSLNNYTVDSLVDQMHEYRESRARANGVRPTYEQAFEAITTTAKSVAEVVNPEDDRAAAMEKARQRARQQSIPR